MEVNMIKVNEIFGPTIQGEGKSAGRPVAFLRLALCNLDCIWCDTPHTWNWIGTKFDHPDKYDYDKEVHEMEVDEIIQKLVATGMTSLVISGGEPFIQQKQLIPLVQELKALGWWIEVETNGTVKPNEEFIDSVDQVNCSPKLANSQVSQKKRERPEALVPLAMNPKVNFKFVIAEHGDIFQTLYFVKEYSMSEVRLMPECRTKEELDQKEPILKALCDQYGFIYCTRLSIAISGTKRGV